MARADSYRVDVGPLVFGAVGAVGEGLAARRVLTQVRFLSGVRPQVDLEVLQPGEGLGAALVLRPISNMQMRWELVEGSGGGNLQSSGWVSLRNGRACG